MTKASEILELHDAGSHVTMTISPEYAEELGRQIDELEAENERLREFSTWVDTWVSNPVTSYSVYALDGIFGRTRDKLAALRRY